MTENSEIVIGNPGADKDIREALSAADPNLS